MRKSTKVSDRIAVVAGLIRLAKKSDSVGDVVGLCGYLGHAQRALRGLVKDATAMVERAYSSPGANAKGGKV